MKEILRESDYFFGQGVRARQRGLVIVHGLVTLYLKVHACDHPSSHRTCCSYSPCHCNKNVCGIDCLDNDSCIVGHCHCIGCFDDSPAYGDNAASSLIQGCARWEDESSFSLFLLLLVLGNLLKNAGRFIGSLTLLKIGNEPKQVCGHHFVCLRELTLMRLGLRKEDLFVFLLHRGQLHSSMDVATIKVAEELYLTPHELMNWHESGLLSGAKPADQLVVNIGEPDNCSKVIPHALMEVRLHMVCFGGASLGNDAHPFI